MPLKKCQRNNQSGWKWGDSGFCYIGPNAKKKAILQGYAIDPEKFKQEVVKSDISDVEDLINGAELSLPEINEILDTRFKNENSN